MRNLGLGTHRLRDIWEYYWSDSILTFKQDQRPHFLSKHRPLTMGIDTGVKQHVRSSHRKAPRSENVYVKLLASAINGILNEEMELC